jgi:hypothetical protein
LGFFEALLKSSGDFLNVSFCYDQIIVSEIIPLLFDPVLELIPFSFNLLIALTNSAL